MYLCIYICIYVHMHVSMYTFIYIYTFVHININIQINVYKLTFLLSSSSLCDSYSLLSEVSESVSLDLYVYVNI
jgi:hypothetical protein